MAWEADVVGSCKSFSFYSKGNGGIGGFQADE